MKTTRKVAAWLLTLAMILTLLPAAAIPARADGPVGISLDMGAVAKNDTVWFGTKDSSPIAWRVLSPKADTTNGVSGSGDVLAIRTYLLNEWTHFKQEVTSNAWAGSDAQTWCTTYYSNWPAGAEKDAIKATSVTETKTYTSKVINDHGGYINDHGGYNYDPATLDDEHFFFLSAQEADTYFADDNDRKAYMSESNETGGSASWWWLRSPNADDDVDAGYVNRDGWVNYRNVFPEGGARPAFNFNLNSVLFSSAAAGGKSTSAAGALDVPAANTTKEWKLTLLDTDETTGQHKNFAVTETTAAAVPGGTVTLTYSGAATGTNEYVSALLCDSTGATVLRYGSSAALTSANGTVSFTVPSDLALGSYKLKVFNEQKNDDYLTDYASAFVEVPLTVGAEPVGISLDMGAVAKNDTVWFGTKGSDPIAWRVLSPKTDTTNAVSGSGDVLAIRKYLLNDRTYFKENGSSNAWAGSDAQTWCTTYYNNWPAGAEKAAIATTSVAESNDKDNSGTPYFYQGGHNNTLNYYGPASLDGEHFFFLSAQEADTYFADDDDRKAYDAADSGSASWWWLRSPDADYDTYAGCVFDDGWVYSSFVISKVGARPVFNFNLNSVLFSSAAAGGKSTSAAGALDAPASNTTKEWKLTLLDTDETTGQHKNFAVTETTAAAVPGGTVTLTYSGAATGTNEYVSALLCDSTGATVLRYGSSAALTSANGTVSFTVPSDLALGNYKLKVFNEQKNNDYLSDYASAFVEVPLTVGYSVGITAGTGMTKTAASGAASQIVANGSAMTAVVYTADEGYYFPTDYAVASVNNVGVTRDSYTQLTVSGTPSANTTIALTAAREKTKPDAPTAGKMDCTTAANNDGKLTGVAADMEYKKSDATGWTSGTDSDITGLTNGTYYVRVKATDTTLASDNQELTIAAYAAPTTYAVTVTNDGHGTGSASPASGASGTEVTLAATPDKGYHFKQWSVVSGGVSIQNNKFTIGAADVEIKAVFEPDAPTPPSGDSGSSRDRDRDGAPRSTTTTNADGSQTTVTTNADGSKTAVTAMKDGSTSMVKTDKNGNILSIEAAPSAAAIEAARQTGAPIRIPATAPVVSAASAASAPTVTITLPDGFGAERVADMPRIEIGVTEGGSGVVAMEKGADGAFTPIRECYEGSVIFPAAHSCEVIIVDNSVRFDDVSDGDWYAGCVTFVTARGIFNGTGGGMFSPNAAMTRAMLAQALYNFDRGAGPKASAFADAAGKWYADAAGWAASVGVVTGTGRGFEGETSVTREQAAAMLYRYAKLCGYHVDASADLSTFSDAEGVSDWAREAMAWAVAVGIINGTVDQDGNIILDAQGTATRAQVAAIVQRFCENVAK